MIPDTTKAIAEVISKGNGGTNGGLFFPILMLVAAIAAAIFAGWTVYVSQRTTKANIMNDLLKEWSSTEMQLAVNKVDEFLQKKFHTDMGTPLNVFRTRIKYAKESGDLRPDAKPCNDGRRTLSHHFHRIACLKDLNYIDNKIMKKVYPKDKADLYISKVKPLDDIFREEYGYEKIWDDVLLQDWDW